MFGSSLTAGLLDRVTDDLESGGVVRDLLKDRLTDPGPSALGLRLMGGVHALVLTGRAPELAAFYPSAGGDRDAGPGAAIAWPALRQLLADHRDEIRSWLLRPPQTNEVGRSTALLGGLRHIAAEADLPINLVEIGSSAGLNLLADQFCVSGVSGRYGDESSLVHLVGGWQGITPPASEMHVASRTGGDVDPIDARSEAGRLSLRAYVWPDQLDRLARLEGALQLAAKTPIDLRQESASQTLARVDVAHGSWLVLWHSVMWQYLESAEQAAVEQRIAEMASSSSQTARFAHLSLEPRRRTPDSHHEFLVTLTTWPGGVQRVLGVAAPHGIPTTWER